jgi:Na+/phosphate symporter
VIFGANVGTTVTAQIVAFNFAILHGQKVANPADDVGAASIAPPACGTAKREPVSGRGFE